MYTPRALFSRLFLQICLFVLSLYKLTVPRPVTLHCKLCVQFPVIMRQQSLQSPRAKYTVCVYIYKVNRIMRFRDMAVLLFF